MNICVYAASSGQVAEAYVGAAQALGAALARRGHRLVNGAGRTGLMGATAEACLAAGGEAIGVIPRFMIEQNWQHKGMTQLIVTQDMHSRKETMAEFSEACIALPGGVGTLEELLEVITWKQLGLYLHPIVILNIDGYYDDLLRMLQKAVDERFMSPLHAEIWRVATGPEEAVTLCETTPSWSKDVRKYAAL